MPTINELQAQIFDLYHARRYAEMADQLTRDKTVLPIEAMSIYFNWQMCAAALQGHVDQALKYFQEAIDAGYWYGRYALYEDTDLATLQANPEYQRLAAIAEARAAQAQAEAKPVLKVFPPIDAPRPYPWLMLLHGNSSNLLPATLDLFRVNLQPATEHGYLLALPQSAQIRAKDSYVWDDIDWSVSEIQRHIANSPGRLPDRSN